MSIICWNCRKTVGDLHLYCPNCTEPATGNPTPLVFGKYRVKEFIGAGTFGRVYKCYDGDLNRDVAVKKISIETNSVQKITNELQIMARLNHPNIAQIYEAHLEKSYFVMEYINGESLEASIKRDHARVQRLFPEIASKICEGLRFAHINRICHRDLKPENIVLTSDDIPKITDFGLARFITETQFGRTLAGTPIYMAPEIWEEKEYDLSVDIYSLGIIFYRIWTGRFPFDATTLFGLQLKVLKGDYIPPKQLNSRMPERLNSLITRMIAQKNERMQSIEHVLAELEEPKRFRKKIRNINDMQKEINSIYSFRNFRRSPLLLVAHLSENVSGLIGGFLSTDPDYGRARVEVFFPRVFAWICSVLTALDWRISEIIEFKFPEICPYCEKRVCACDLNSPRRESNLNYDLLAKICTQKITLNSPAKSFKHYQEMFARIYQEKNRQAGMHLICLRFFSKVSNVTGALLRVKALEQLRQVDILHLELAALIGWFFAILNLYEKNYDFETAFSETFPGRCYWCHQEKCRCPEIDNEIRLANWRDF